MRTGEASALQLQGVANVVVRTASPPLAVVLLCSHGACRSLRSSTSKAALLLPLALRRDVCRQCRSDSPAGVARGRRSPVLAPSRRVWFVVDA